MPDITRRDAVLSGLGAAVAVPTLAAAGSSSVAQAAPAKGRRGAAQHKFEMNIEETRITLVGQQTFQTFAFAGQVPAPLFHVREGDEVEVVLNNLTTLPHTIHWHGILQRGTW